MKNPRKFVTADRSDIEVQPVHVEPSDVVEEIAEERPSTIKDLAKIPDDKKVYWKDVKTKFPQIADYLNKNVFKGRAQLTVRQLKDMMTEFDITDEDAYWISLDEWDGMQREFREPQIVVQLNINDKMLAEIKENPVVFDFMEEFFQSFSGRMHPMHGQTIAWARVYKFPEKWVVEEIQSDLYGADTDIIKKPANSSITRLLKTFTKEEQEEIQKFLSERFEDWDKQLMSAIFEMARAEGAREVWMFDEEVKAKVLQSKSKLKRYYKLVPRDLGFQKATLKKGGKTLKAWRRAVASKRDDLHTALALVAY